MPWLRNTTWRQGSVLVLRNFQVAGLNDSSDAGLAVAISHDCDIANDNLDAEPVVEFICARIVEQPNGNYTLGKNPRILHLDYRHEGKPVFLELLASKKVSLSKNALAAIQPDESYKLMGSLQVLQSWLSVRYRRHALPNSLIERLRDVFVYLEKEGKKNSDGILSFRLSYDPLDELPPEEAYELWISIIYITDDAMYGTMAESMAQKLETEFPRLLRKTEDKGTVDLRQCKAFSEMEFTLRDMRETVEYHLEHLSYRTDPPGPIL